MRPRPLLSLGLSLAWLVLASPVSGPAFAAAAKGKADAKKKSFYGAIAWHRDSSSVGYSYDFATARLAGTEALRQCGHPQCEVALSLHNECGALSASPKTFAARRGFTEAEARAKAASACGPGCHEVAWACTK